VKTLTLVSRCGRTAPSRKPIRGCRPPGYGNTSSGASGGRFGRLSARMSKRFRVTAISPGVRPVAAAISPALKRWYHTMFRSQ
jgi:hypothetical protein